MLLAAGGILALVTVVRIGHALAQYSREAASERAAAAEHAQQAAIRKEAECRRSATCWGDRHHVAAIIACKHRVAQEAKFTPRWPSGWLSIEFPVWEWRDQAAGTLVYAGSVDLQNGFGAWAPYTVGCLFDPTSGRAIDLELIAGHP